MKDSIKEFISKVEKMSNIIDIYNLSFFHTLTGGGSDNNIYQFNNKGQYEGDIRDWFENGLPYRKMNYVNGKEVGSQKIWNNEGKIMGNYSVVNGERFGLVNFKNCYTVINSKNQVGKDD